VLSHRALVEQALDRLAQETGTLFRQAPVRVALAYPSPYHVGMSSLGFQAVYGRIHALPFATAERAFLPDDVDAHRGVPLFTLESQRPASEAQVLAFSVAYELELPGVFSVLELAGLPVLSSQRPANAPLVVAGGPLTFSNPAPLEPFVDLLVQGEAEDLIVPLLTAVRDSSSKREVLERLAHVPGFFVPGLTDETRRFFVAKATDTELPARSLIVTPNTELRSMFLIEPERGCSRGCHYCVMRRTTNGGMRTVEVERVLELIPDWATRVGFVGAAVTDHPRIAELLETVAGSGREVGVSSLRADRLNARLVKALKDGGAKGLTVASDGPSQRLRDAVDRKHNEAQILNAARLAKDAGLKRLKVYNIVGLPTEEDSDIDELVRFTVELSKILPVALGVAPFAAKRNTPMDGTPFAGIGVVEERLKRLQRGLRGRAEVRPTSAKWAWVEYMLAQSGPEAGLAALDAHRNGAGFSAWKRAFEEHGVKPFLARRTEDGRRKAVTWPMVHATS
jgi:radical SAM superfamily enzyme YgiQ (UPF0313 family)